MLNRNPYKWGWREVSAAMKQTLMNPVDPYQQLRDEGFDVDEVVDAMRHDGATDAQIAATFGGIQIGIVLCQTDH